MGFKTVALNRKAAEVMDILAAAKTQYDKFAVSLDKVEKKINEAGSALTDVKMTLLAGRAPLKHTEGD